METLFCQSVQHRSDTFGLQDSFHSGHPSRQIPRAQYCSFHRQFRSTSGSSSLLLPHMASSLLFSSSSISEQMRKSQPYHIHSYTQLHMYSSEQPSYVLISQGLPVGTILTFVQNYPAELFPTKFRATAHGISAACRKGGAVVSAIGFQVNALSKDLGTPAVPWSKLPVHLCGIRG